MAQAAAFAFARGGGYIGFVSRYEDLLAVGGLANAIALWRLLHGLPGRSKWPALALSAAWIALLVPGLTVVSTRGHTEYFHGHSAEWAQIRREAVRNYLSSHDIDMLGRPEVRHVLYPNPEVVAQALDQPRLVALLPAGLRVSADPSRGDKFSALASAWRARWLWFAWAGAALLLVGILLGTGSASESPGVLSWNLIPRLPLLLGGAAVISGALLFLWPGPFKFSAEARREALLAPAGSAQGLDYEFVNPSSFTKEQLEGAAQLWPDALRGRFHGTFIDGPDFIGIVRSARFRLTTPWLVIPYSGYVVSPGNGLHLRIEDDAGRVLDEIDCLLPNTTDIGFWPADVRAYAGRWARVMLYDGRDDAEGWVAAAAPQPSPDANLAAARQEERAMEPTRYGQNSLGVLACGFLVLAGLFALLRGKPEPR